MSMSVFNGTWKIDLARSRKWDPAAGVHGPDAVGEELAVVRQGVLVGLGLDRL